MRTTRRMNFENDKNFILHNIQKFIDFNRLSRSELLIDTMNYAGRSTRSTSLNEERPWKSENRRLEIIAVQTAINIKEKMLLDDALALYFINKYRTFKLIIDSNRQNDQVDFLPVPINIIDHGGSSMAGQGNCCFLPKATFEIVEQLNNMANVHFHGHDKIVLSWPGCGNMEEILFLFFSGKIDKKFVIQANELDKSPIESAFLNEDFILFYVIINDNFNQPKFHVSFGDVMDSKTIFPYRKTDIIWFTGVVNPLLYLGIITKFTPKFLIMLQQMFQSLAEHFDTTDWFRFIDTISGELRYSSSGISLDIKQVLQNRKFYQVYYDLEKLKECHKILYNIGKVLTTKYMKNGASVNFELDFLLHKDGRFTTINIAYPLQSDDNLYGKSILKNIVNDHLDNRTIKNLMGTWYNSDRYTRFDKQNDFVYTTLVKYFDPRNGKLLSNI